MTETPACVLGEKSHKMVLVTVGGNLIRKCLFCKLDERQIASMNQATAMALTIESVLLLLDDSASPDSKLGEVEVYEKMKLRLFNAGRLAGLIPERSKEDDDDG